MRGGLLRLHSRVSTINSRCTNVVHEIQGEEGSREKTGGGQRTVEAIADDKFVGNLKSSKVGRDSWDCHFVLHTGTCGVRE